jgi:hypothetical protein
LFKLLPPALTRRLRDAWRQRFAAASAGGSATPAKQRGLRLRHHKLLQPQQHQAGVSAAAPVNGAATTTGSSSTAEPVAEWQEGSRSLDAADAAASSSSSSSRTGEHQGLQQVVVLPAADTQPQPATSGSLRNRRGTSVAHNSSSSSARPVSRGGLMRLTEEWQRAADSLGQGTSLQVGEDAVGAAKQLLQAPNRTRA